jgi:hypothetical protein
MNLQSMDGKDGKQDTQEYIGVARCSEQVGMGVSEQHDIKSDLNTLFVSSWMSSALS